MNAQPSRLNEMRVRSSSDLGSSDSSERRRRSSLRDAGTVFVALVSSERPCRRSISSRSCWLLRADPPPPAVPAPLSVDPPRSHFCSGTVSITCAMFAQSSRMRRLRVRNNVGLYFGLIAIIDCQNAEKIKRYKVKFDLIQNFSCLIDGSEP